MTDRATTLARLLVSGMWAAAGRPADARRTRWSDVASRSRDLAIGLIDRGGVAGEVVTVDRDRLRPIEVVAAEVAVWVAGGSVRLSGTGAGVVLGRRAGGPGPDLDVDALVLAGRRADVAPAAHEERLAALDPDAVAVLADGAELTHAQLAWGLRSAQQWLREILPEPPAVAAVAADRVDAAGVLLTRWWPAVEGARTVPVRPGTLPAVVVEVAADVVVVDPTEWHAVAGRLREVAPDVRFGAATLRAGRTVAAGEPAPVPITAGANVGRIVVGRRIRDAAGMASVTAGVCLGSPSTVDARDLDAAGLTVLPTWLEPALAAPVAAGVTGSGRTEGWGRPLPGRIVEVGPPTTVTGGDLDAPIEVAPTRAHGHGVLLPRERR